ncbi:MAG: inositol monophosphatase family protein [Victivallales bacterium]
MKNWDIQKLLPLLRECGEIALRYYDDPPMEVKADKSIVTAADKAIEKRLAEEFDRPEEGVYLIGEETVKNRSEEYIQNALHGTAWVVDPIDGTAPYSIGLPAWGISVAFMENGVIKEGAVYLPPQNDCLFTDGERVRRCADMRGGGEPEDFEFKLRPLSPESVICVSQLGVKNALFHMSNQIFSWSGCVASLYCLFTGKVLAYIASLNLWDIAASLAIMERSSIVARAGNGKKLTGVMDDDFFELAPDCGERWKLRSYAVIAPDDETVDFVLQNSKFSERL